MVSRGMPYGFPGVRNRASGMHGRSVQVMPVVQLFVKVLMIMFLDRFVMTVQRAFHLLLCLGKAHAAIGGFTDSR